MSDIFRAREAKTVAASEIEVGMHLDRRSRVSKVHASHGQIFVKTTVRGSRLASVKIYWPDTPVTVLVDTTESETSP